MTDFVTWFNKNKAWVANLILTLMLLVLVLMCFILVQHIDVLTTNPCQLCSEEMLRGFIPDIPSDIPLK